MSNEFKYYDIKELEEAAPAALFYLVFGERSKGKSYSVSKELTERAYKKDDKGCFIIIRRTAEEIRPSNARTYFDAITENNEISEYCTEGKYDRITYYNKAYYLAYRDPETNKIIKREKPVAYVVNLSTWMNYKSNQYTNVVGVIIEEYLTYPQFYLPDEEQALQNMLSTIIRNNDGIKIYALGNTVSKAFNPLHSLLGVSKIVKEMEQGSIRIVKVNDKLTIALEHTTPGGEKPSDVYFVTGGNSNTADMITGKTAWETKVYPHIPEESERYIKRENLQYTFYIEVTDGDSTDYLTMEIYDPEGEAYPFIYVKKKYSELRYNDDDLVFSNKPKKLSHRIRRNILNPPDDLGKRILQILTRDNGVFYQTNEAGDILASYILSCKNV